MSDIFNFVFNRTLGRGTYFVYVCAITAVLLVVIYSFTYQTHFYFHVWGAYFLIVTYVASLRLYDVGLSRWWLLLPPCLFVVRTALFMLFAFSPNLSTSFFAESLIDLVFIAIALLYVVLGIIPGRIKG